jgi:hypothetical protein
MIIDPLIIMWSEDEQRQGKMLHRHQVVETYFCGSHQLSARIPRFSFDLLATFFCEIFFLSAETHRWTRLYVGIATLFFFWLLLVVFTSSSFCAKDQVNRGEGKKTTTTTTLKKRKEITKFQSQDERRAASVA